MNNSARSELNTLHREYLRCVNNQMKDFLEKPVENASASADYAKEWCSTEKKSYFSHMSTHFKTEYENLLRLETQNY
jgi:Mg2+ and Co2+ transporter CorA